MIYILLSLLLFLQSYAQQELPVLVKKVKKETIKQSYKTTGILKSDKSVFIKPEVSGKVIKIFVDEGYFVEKGTPLLSIQTDKYDYQYNAQKFVVKKLESIYRYKKNLYMKKKLLFEKELISEDEYNIAKLDMETALLDLKSAEEKLKELERQKKETIVKSPFSGTIDKRFVSEGDFVNVGMKLFYLLDLDSLKLRFSLPQRFINTVKIRDSIDVEIEGIGKLKGKIVYISSSLDENSLIHYKAVLEKNELLKENMYAVVKILEKTIKGFKVPEKAVHLSKDGSFVYVVENNTTKKKVVKVLGQDYGYMFVDGLKDGDLVIVSAPFGIREGAKVYIEEIL